MRKRTLWTLAMLTGCCILAGCNNQSSQTDETQQMQEESTAADENTDQNTPPEKPDGEASDGGDGYANLVIDKDSTWIVTGDSVLTSLTNNGTIADADGKSVTILDTNGKILANGESGYTITVDSLTE